MQFSVVAILAVLAASASATPTGVKYYGRAGCDAAKCAIAVGPTAVGCVSAAVQAGADPISDAGCLAGGANLVANSPAACTGCESALAASAPGKAVTGAISTAASAVSGAAKSAESAIAGIF